MDVPLVACFREAIHRDYPEAEAGERGWQRPAAERIGISQTLVSQLYAGKKTVVDTSTLVKIARYTHRSTDELLGLVRR